MQCACVNSRPVLNLKPQSQFALGLLKEEILDDLVTL